MCAAMIVGARKILKMLASWVPGNELRISLLRACGYQIGKDVYVGPGFVVADELGDSGSDVLIEDRVSIGPGVIIVTASSPNNSRLGTIIAKEKGPVVIKADAWIGARAVLLPNTTVGEMSIVGAGAVVVESIPSRCVAAGVPARVTRRIEGVDVP